MRGFQLQFAHRQFQLGAPEIQAIPLQLAGVALEQRLQLHLGHRPAHAMQFGVALGQVFEPEMVVVMQVQQGAVHVQQNRIDLMPGQQSHKTSPAVIGYPTQTIRIGRV
ncbi:hypothetical protein FQZ97_1074330 [compost metagenome]